MKKRSNICSDNWANIKKKSKFKEKDDEFQIDYVELQMPAVGHTQEDEQLAADNRNKTESWMHRVADHQKRLAQRHTYERHQYVNGNRC